MNINNAPSFCRKIIILLFSFVLLTLPGCFSGKTHASKDPQHRGIKDIKPDPGLNIPRLSVDHDQDGDGVKDLEDILHGAREDARNRPSYRSAYYSGGYPPNDEGVCSDTIWRALKSAGYNLKNMVDMDIKANVRVYERVNGDPDPNIDFRRVPNLVTFFKRHASVLTIQIIPGNTKNLQEWQGGDIVVFGKPLDHIAIVSDKRRQDGVPLIIHNSGPYTQEEDMLLYWHENISPIIYHFRYPKQE